MVRESEALGQAVGEENELDYLWAAVELCKNQWKLLRACLLIGLALVVGFSFYQGIYRTSFVLANDAEIDFAFAKRLQMQLPRVAQIFTEGLSASVDQNIDNSRWWASHFKLNFLFDKADLNRVEATDENKNKILNFEFDFQAQTANNGLSESIELQRFFSSSAVYLATKDILDKYAIDVEAGPAELEKQTQDLLINLGYLQVQKSNLEKLQKTYPDSNLPSIQTLEFKEDSKKFLPLKIQLIALNEEIYSAQEKLEKIQDKKALLMVKQQVLELVRHPSKEQTDQFELLVNLDTELSLLLEKVSASDAQADRKKMAIVSVRNDLKTVWAKFHEGLSRKTPPTIEMVQWWPRIVGGLLFGFLLFFMNYGLQRLKKALNF